MPFRSNPIDPVATEKEDETVTWRITHKHSSAEAGAFLEEHKHLGYATKRGNYRDHGEGEEGVEQVVTLGLAAASRPEWDVVEVLSRAAGEGRGA